jgi:hypothetical protein
MADDIGVHTDFQIYQAHMQTGFNETLKQMTDAFNGASLGTITMSTNLREGEYAREAFFTSVASLNSRRDLTTLPETVITQLALAQEENILVKLFRKIGPVSNSIGSFRTIMRDPGEFSFLIGAQAAKATAIDQLNSGLIAGKAAMSGTAAMVHDVSGSPSNLISTDNLVQAIAKAGDRANEIVLWVMHSVSYWKLVRQQIGTHEFDSVAGFNIARGEPVTLGRPVLVTDAPSLYTADSPLTPGYVLGLRAGAIRLEDAELSDMVVQTVTGGAQLAVRFQGEYAFSVGVKGYKWDIANGAGNPTDATLATASNWDDSATSDKDRAGVMMISDVT